MCGGSHRVAGMDSSDGLPLVVRDTGKTDRTLRLRGSPADRGRHTRARDATVPAGCRGAGRSRSSSVLEVGLLSDRPVFGGYWARASLMRHALTIRSRMSSWAGGRRGGDRVVLDRDLRSCGLGAICVSAQLVGNREQPRFWGVVGSAQLGAMRPGAPHGILRDFGRPLAIAGVTVGERIERAAVIAVQPFEKLQLGFRRADCPVTVAGPARMISPLFRAVRPMCRRKARGAWRETNLCGPELVTSGPGAARADGPPPWSVSFPRRFLKPSRWRSSPEREPWGHRGEEFLEPSWAPPAFSADGWRCETPDRLSGACAG